MKRPLALVTCAVLGMLPSLASAKPKVALTPIDGDSSGDVRAAVVDALDGGGELSLIASKEVNRAVDKLGDVADLTDKDVKKLANELEADAVVLGKLDKVGKSNTLKFRLFVHKKMAKGFTVSFKDAKSSKFKTMLHDKMVEKIGGGGGGGGDDEGEDTKKKAKSGDDDENPLAGKGEKTDKKVKADKKKKGEEEEEETKKADKKKKAKGDDEETKEALKTKKSKGDDEETKESKADKKKKGGDDEEKSDEVAKKGDDEGSEKKKKGDDEDEDAPKAKKKKTAKMGDDEGVEAESGDVATKLEGNGRSANRYAVRLDVGVSVLQRSFAFNATAIDGHPNSTKLSPVPGARVEGELYPLALMNPRSPAAGLGLAFEYDKTLSLNVASSNMPGVKVPVKQSNYSFGVRYRLMLGSGDQSPSVTVGIGYGKRLFSTDRSKLMEPQAITDIVRDTPETEYAAIDPGISARIPVSKYVALFLGGRGLIITNAGPIQHANSYGRGKVYGALGDAGFDIILGNRFAIRVEGQFAQVGFSFQGVGELSNNLDGDPTTKDVGGLADRSIGGAVTLGVMY